MDNIEVKEVSIEEAFKVHQNVLEFQEEPISKEYLEERYKNLPHLIIVAYLNHMPVGYIIAYDKYKDKSLYCWMAGVDNKYRRIGVLTYLMDYQTSWAKKHGYNKIKIKTRNVRREMISFLVKNNFNFTSVEQKEFIIDNRINLEKNI